MTAMAALAAEHQRLLAAPVARGPSGTDFVDAAGQIWEVKAPASPQEGDPWTFSARDEARSIRCALRKISPRDPETGLRPARRVILDLTMLREKDQEALWMQVARQMNPEESGRISWLVLRL